VAGQRIYVARLGARPVGFATFHCLPGDWALDLLRPHPAAPEGTAQALVAAALADAQRAGVARLSLAAVPEAAFADGTGPAAWLLRRGRPGRGRPGRNLAAAQGLWQFKAAFAPRWERRYVAAPGWAALALAALDLHRAIRRPLPLPRPPPASLPVPPAARPAEPPRRPAPAAAAPCRAEFGFASPRNAWHREAG
jgi:phosphatidylglycerol lysyltransferase